MLLCSCAVLQYRNIPMIRALVSWTVKHIADLSIVDMCNTMWAMAELYYSPGRDVMRRLEGQVAMPRPHYPTILSLRTRFPTV